MIKKSYLRILQQSLIAFFLILLSVKTFGSETSSLSDTSKLDKLWSKMHNDTVHLNLRLLTSGGLIYNKTFGTHFNVLLGLGFESKSGSMFSIIFEHRFDKSANTYQVLDNNALKSTSQYNANYFGFGFQKVLIRKPMYRLYLVIGYGADWFTISKNEIFKNDICLKASAYDVGLGQTLYIKKKYGIAVTLLYHYCNFNRNTQENIFPHSFLMRVTYLFKKVDE